jgi:Carboxypeptidase regulatory-like domain
MKTTALLALCLVAVLDAQAPPRDPPGAVVAAPTGTASLSGLVVDGDAHPLRRAAVSISGDMRLTVSTMTDDEGRWAFSDLPAGRFTITASKPGYPAMSYGAKRANRAGSGVLLTAGQAVTGVALTLLRGGVLSGIVLDAAGQPMPDVPIMAWEVRTSLGGERTLDFPATGGESVRTDDRGMYRVYGLPPGEYTVGTFWAYSGLGRGVRVPSDEEIRAAFEAAQAAPGSPAAMPGQPAAETAATYDYSSVFYPNSIDPMEASTVTLAAGEERDGLNIQMQFRPMGRIVATISGPEGMLPRVEFSVHRRSRVSALNTTSMRLAFNGHVETESLAAGDYTVRASAPGDGNGPPLWAQAEVTVSGGDPVPVALFLAPAMTATGRVVFEGATPPPSDLTKGVRLILQGVGSDPGQRTGNPSIEADGTFSIPGVAPGSYRLTALVPNPGVQTGPVWTCRSVMFQGRDVTDLPIDIASGTNAPSFEVTFTDQISELSGAIVDRAGKPVTDDFILAVPADQRYWLPQSRRIVSARPDVTGHFRFRGLPPGDYRVAATTDLVPRDLADATALAQITAQSTPVTIGVGETKTLNLAIGP